MLLRRTVKACAFAGWTISVAAACGEGRRNVPTRGNDGGAAGVGGAAQPSGSPAIEAGAPTIPDPIEEPFVDPYPRMPADPSLTHPLVAGEVALLGSGLSTCTNEVPAAGDRWCVFSRGGETGGTELWVVNVTVAISNGPVSCDGTELACVRLTTNLWTGSQLWGPSHPYTQRFDGDTLIFTPALRSLFGNLTRDLCSRGGPAGLVRAASAIAAWPATGIA